MGKQTVAYTVRLSLVLFIFTLSLKAQRFSVETLVSLPEEVHESSGLIFINDRIITHNDGGGDAVLYEIDVDDGTLLRELAVAGSSNMDWEDLCMDQHYIYIADIGNNDGDRTDLLIYRVAVQNYLQSGNDGVVVDDTIKFAYIDQSNFEPDQRTNFDAAALIELGDSLYIFTKNWGDLHSNIYSLPKTPGDYMANRVGRINSEGLITGAVRNIESGEIMLTGYHLTGPFLMRLSGYNNIEFLNGDIDRMSFVVPGSFQIEGIEAIDEANYYISSETNQQGVGTLYLIQTDFLVATNDPITNQLSVYPNPAQGSLTINGLEHPLESIAISNILGSRIYIPQTTHFGDNQMLVDLTGIHDGYYNLKITTEKARLVQKLIIR